MLALGDAALESHAESEPEDVAGSGDEPSDEDEESDRDPDDLNEVLAALLASMVGEPEVRPARAESELGLEPAATCEKAPHKADPQAQEPCLPPVGMGTAGSSTDPIPGSIVAQPVLDQPSSAVEAPPPPPQPLEARRPYTRGYHPTRFRQGSITFYPDS